MAAITKEQWNDARSDWENGLSLDKTAKKYGVSVTTVRNHKEKEGWVRKGETPDSVDDPVAVPAEVFPEVAEATEVEQLRAELAKLQAERDTLARDVALSLPTTVEGVIQFYTRQHLEFVALNRYNRQRRNQGFNPVELLSGDPVLERETLKLAEQLLTRQKSWAGESNLRTYKMAKKNPSSPSGWTITAIPFEPTINNAAAGPAGQAEAINRYVRKGFRLIVPQLCQRGPCYAPAAIEKGKLLFQGYCSQAHMDGDPFINANRVRGVTTTASAVSSGLELTAVVR